MRNGLWPLLCRSLCLLCHARIPRLTAYTSRRMQCNLSEQSGAVEACWAHNPEVRGSKPRSANAFISRHPHPFYSRPHCQMSRHQHSLSLGRTFPDPIHTHARYHYQCSSQHVLSCTSSGLYYYKRQSCAISHIQHLFHLL